MNPLHKSELCKIIEIERGKIGSLKAVANKVGASEATISQMVNKNWDDIADKMWRKVAAGLGWKPKGWQIADITNTRFLHQVFNDAKQQSMWIPCSHKAGSGKTEAAKSYIALNTNDAVYLIQCQEWGARAFLLEIIRALGISLPNGYQTAYGMTRLIADFFKQRAHLSPLLIIDEADKLKAPALRSLIPLYNQLEDEIGCVIMGTENLQKEIKRGVRFDKKGYDEIDSRFGRNFINLLGTTKTDVSKICEANGIKVAATITDIWNECEPVKTNINGSFVSVITDLRKLKRAVQRETIKSAAFSHN